MKRKRKHFKFSDNYNLYFAKKKKKKKNIEYVIFFLEGRGQHTTLFSESTFPWTTLSESINTASLIDCCF